MASYGVIRRVDGGWVFTPPSGSEIPHQNFVHLLNQLANQGWKPLLAGDFLESNGDDIIVEK